MKLLTLFSCFTFVLASIVQAGSAGNLTRRCSGPLAERHEWRRLSNDQKTEYLNAVKCLHSLPAKGEIKAAKTRFDDFQATHISLTDEIHLVGQFLPWHRRFLNVYETALREECGYTGYSPYWNWSIDVDAGSFAKSPVFDPVYGFGGDGVNIPGYSGQFGNNSEVVGWEYGFGGGCVQDGPFASYNLSLGPGTLVTNHCLQRAFTPALYEKLSSAQVANTTKQPTFEIFRIELEGAPITPTIKIHDGGHFSVGGEMSNRYSSPGDPIFYLHHANLDRIWWYWQQVDPENRLYQISGRSSVDPPYVNVTLDYELKMRGLAPLVSIRDVMDIRNELLCYTYV